MPLPTTRSGSQLRMRSRDRVGVARPAHPVARTGERKRRRRDRRERAPIVDAAQARPPAGLAQPVSCSTYVADSSAVPARSARIGARPSTRGDAAIRAPSSRGAAASRRATPTSRRAPSTRGGVMRPVPSAAHATSPPSEWPRIASSLGAQRPRRTRRPRHAPADRARRDRRSSSRLVARVRRHRAAVAAKVGDVDVEPASASAAANEPSRRAPK